MSALREDFENYFSLKAFAYGFLGVVAFYCLLFMYAFFQQASTVEALEETLASQVSLIERPVVAHHLSSSVQNPVQESSGHEQNHSSETSEHDGGQMRQPEGSKELEDIIQVGGKALREAPVPGFFEDGPFGPLPIAKSAIQTPFEIYRKPFLINEGRPTVSIAVYNFGLSKLVSDQMLDNLPSSVSFILSPYSLNPEEWVKKARKRGHEVWMGVPMENNNFPLDDPGAQALLTRVNLQYNRDRIDWILGRATGYAGVAAYSDSSLENAAPMFEKIARDMFRRGLGYLEINPDSDSFWLPFAAELKAPEAQSIGNIEIFKDGDMDLLAILKEKQNGVLTVTASQTNILNLSKWLKAVDAENIQIVPVSAIAAQNQTHAVELRRALKNDG